MFAYLNLKWFTLTFCLNFVKQNKNRLNELAALLETETNSYVQQKPLNSGTLKMNNQHLNANESLSRINGTSLELVKLTNFLEHISTISHIFLNITQ